MTISSTTRIAGPFTGTGVATTFPFSFKVFQASDLYVVKLTVSTGAETVLTVNTDYTVTLNGNQDSNPGGNVILPAVLASGYTLTISSDIANLQPTDLTNQGGFYPEVITDALDRATIQIQQISDIGDRTIKIPFSDGTGLNMTLPAAAERANTFMAFDANGEPSMVAAGSSGAPATITRQVFSGTGSQVAFTLASDPGAIGNSAQVYIGGVYQQRSTYTIAGTTLTFSSAPVAGTNNIEFVNFLTDTIGSTSADLVTYTPSGTGAVARSAASKFGETVSVKDFGAVGDGVADDTAAINAAVASLGVLGGSLLFPSGTYRLASTTSLASRQTHIPISGKSNICFSGYGATLVSEYSAATLNDTGVLFGIQSSQNIVVEGFRVVTEFDRTIGTSTANDYGCWTVGIYSSTESSINVTARNLFVANAFAVLGIFPTSFRTQNVVVENCSIDLAYYGINCQGNGDNVRVENFRTKYVRRSYFVYGVTNHVVNYVSTGQDVPLHDCLISAVEGTTTNDIDVRAEQHWKSRYNSSKLR
jgi:hypothetical protein